MQDPVATKVKTPSAVTVHTGVRALKLTARPEVAVAVKVGVDPNACAPGLGKLMVWLAFGVTALEAADAGPVPAAFVAVTVNV